MHISWCFDVKHVGVDARALSDHVYRSFPMLSCPCNVLYLLPCIHFFLILYLFLIDIFCSDVYWRYIIYNNSVDMYNVQTGLKSDDPDWC